MDPVIVENVVKIYGQGPSAVKALGAAQGVSLRVTSGQFLAIMGASGSGKSTLLYMVAGLTSPTSGRVMIDEQDIGVMGDRELTIFRRRKIGLVFQSFNLIPTLTAAENVALPLRLDGQNGSGVMDKVDWALKRLGLESRRDHRPDAMSGGEQQRVAIARALVTRPAVLLADEPTGNLDSINSRKLCQLLQELAARDGVTIVMVTHEPTVAAWAQRIVFIRDGMLVDQFAMSEIAGQEELALRYQTTMAGGENGSDES